MYRQFNIQQFYVLPTHCIYVLCVDLRTNSNFCLVRHQHIGFNDRSAKCLQRGTDWHPLHNTSSFKASIFLPNPDTVKSISRPSAGHLVAQWLYRKRHGLDHLGFGSLQYQEIFPFSVTTRTPLGPICSPQSVVRLSTATVNRLGQCFPNIFACRTPRLPSQNNNGSPLPCSPKHKVSIWWIFRITNLYLRCFLKKATITYRYWYRYWYWYRYRT